MTFQTFKTRVLTIALIVMASLSIQAQETGLASQNDQNSMQALIGQSLSKVQESAPVTFLNCIAEMKRIDAMFPDSVQPKHAMAL